MVCMTASFFNQLSHENTELSSVELLDQTHLSQLLGHQSYYAEVERMLYLERQYASAGSF